VQPVDFTTLSAVCHGLRSHWLPARCEQVVQRDRYTLCMALRTLDTRGWLTISWHPQAARIHIGGAPPRRPDTFTFSQQLKHQLNGLALTHLSFLAPWERAIDLQFARRPGEDPDWHLYIEIMGKYSNVMLTNAQQEIVTAAHQVNEQQSRVRVIRTGGLYEAPPAILGPLPKAEEPFEQWQSRISLVPGPLRKMLLKAYSGLSSALIQQMLIAANLPADLTTDQMTEHQWQRLFTQWQTWLSNLQTHTFQPGWSETGYTVLGWGLQTSADSIHSLLEEYYRTQLNQQTFTQLHHHLSQKLTVLLTKLHQKANTFTTRLAQSDQADDYRSQADLLMAHLQTWKPGLKTIDLPDFETGEPVRIPLDPDKNAVQNAQALYKQHQKLKRARDAVIPLLADVQNEMNYLEQVDTALTQVPTYTQEADLLDLEEIREELIEQGYLSPLRDTRSPERARPNYHRVITPNGLELLIGRNNHQNDSLTFKVATPYDLWFHTQEIPGSHVLLRLNPGDAPSDQELAFAADVTAYFSRARQSEQVPVVYTTPKHVYKLKGERPGMVVYRHETVLWGHPQRAKAYLEQWQSLTSKDSSPG
jgi:predicted ribosome quality control (RQC) complex YloA/Tae2 family protein